MICERTKQTHQYHDGELSPSERTAHEAHVGDCPHCRELLDSLRGISRLIGEASAEPMPPECFSRLRQVRPASDERAILRITGWCTAAAASILLASVLSWPADRTEVVAQPDIWGDATLAVIGELNDNPDPELLVMAQWMANDLASVESGELR